MQPATASTTTCQTLAAWTKHIVRDTGLILTDPSVTPCVFIYGLGDAYLHILISPFINAFCIFAVDTYYWQLSL